MKGDGSGAAGVRPAGDDVEGLSYERALAELDQIIERLERGAVALDEAIAAYERGARLAQHCGSLLDRTEQKVTQLVVGAGGRITEKPLEPEREAVEDSGSSAGAPRRRAPRTAATRWRSTPTRSRSDVGTPIPSRLGASSSRRAPSAAHCAVHSLARLLASLI